jgi:hypothetical protein
MKFKTVEPKILYFGTPVALISSLNEDETTNLAPMSSFWALGWTVVLGVLDETKTAENLARHPECVVNVPSPDLWQQVEKLAPLTGKDPVPEIKAKQFHFERVIDRGGAILFASIADHGIVGTCALYKSGPGAFELTKMGVRESARGLKAGETLLHAAILRASKLGAKKL